MRCSLFSVIICMEDNHFKHIVLVGHLLCSLLTPERNLYTVKYVFSANAFSNIKCFMRSCKISLSQVRLVNSEIRIKCRYNCI